jgi:hypothetical protein
MLGVQAKDEAGAIVVGHDLYYRAGRVVDGVFVPPVLQPRVHLAVLVQGRMRHMVARVLHDFEPANYLMASEILTRLFPFGEVDPDHIRKPVAMEIFRPDSRGPALMGRMVGAFLTYHERLADVVVNRWLCVVTETEYGLRNHCVRLIDPAPVPIHTTCVLEQMGGLYADITSAYDIGADIPYRSRCINGERFFMEISPEESAGMTPGTEEIRLGRVIGGQEVRA